MSFEKFKQIWGAIDEMAYPGAPFMAFIARDGEKILVNGREYTEPGTALADINSIFIMQIVGSDLHRSADGVSCGAIAPVKTILAAGEGDFSIADASAAQAWLLAHKIIEDPNGPSMVYYDEDLNFVFADENISEEKAELLEHELIGRA